MLKIKYLLIALIVFCGSVFSDPVVTPWKGSPELPELVKSESTPFTFNLPFTLPPGDWTEGLFAAGDTTDTYTVQNAKIVYFLFHDSTLTGTDSLGIYLQLTMTSTSLTYKAALAVHNLATTTITTYVAAPLIPGAGATVCYVWYPANIGAPTFTGTFFIARLNVNDNVTPYVPKTRYAFMYQ